MLINVKMQTIVGLLTFMSLINLLLSGDEHEKSFITLGLGHLESQKKLHKHLKLNEFTNM